MNIIESGLKFGSLSKRGKTTAVVLHNVEAKTCTIYDIHRWHLNNGWSGCGYHFFIQKNGAVYRGRPVDTVGAHASNHNSYTVGICLEGSFNNENPTDAQYNACAALIKHIRGIYPSAVAVYGHKELMSTDCPGKNFNKQKAISGVSIPNTKPQAAIPGIEYSGSNRYATNKRVGDAGHRNAKNILTTTGANWPDAACGLWAIGQLKGRLNYVPDATLALNGYKIAGPDRFATNAFFNEVVPQKFPELKIPKGCIVVNGQNYPDAVVAAPHSYNLGYPILLFADTATFREQLKRFSEIIVVGGTNVVPKLAGETKRFSGANRAATAVAVAKGLSASRKYINIVNSTSFADGMSIAQAEGGCPTLFAGAKETLDYVKSIKSQIQTINWIGDKSAIPEAQRIAIAKAAGKM